MVSAIHAASLATKLLQIASGAVYDENGNYHLIDKDRYELVTDLIEARPHCIVFFLWKHQRDMLIKAAKAQGLTYCVIDGETTDKERTDAVRNFQAGFYRVCFAHPQSAAHGLTLTKGTRTIWASPTYNLEHFLQGNKRIYRTGQTEKTETIVITASGTLEEKVWMRLQEKSLKQGDLLELLKTE
jgi:SNF2 family DNA or RNA helicase